LWQCCARNTGVRPHPIAPTNLLVAIARRLTCSRRGARTARCLHTRCADGLLQSKCFRQQQRHWRRAVTRTQNEGRNSEQFAAPSGLLPLCVPAAVPVRKACIGLLAGQLFLYALHQAVAAPGHLTLFCTCAAHSRTGRAGRQLMGSQQPRQAHLLFPQQIKMQNRNF